MIEVELVGSTSNPNYVCGSAAAICTGSTDLIHSLKSAMASGHDSVLEHASFTFRIDGISRACSHQLVRHRLASFAQESQRYTVDGNWAESVSPPPSLDGGMASEFYDAVHSAESAFNSMVAMGVPLEDARMILPQCVTTRMIVTMNARELKHFFALRCCNRAQWEIREVANRMLSICKLNWPLIFGGMGPSCMGGKCPEGKRSCGLVDLEQRGGNGAPTDKMPPLPYVAAYDNPVREVRIRGGDIPRRESQDHRGVPQVRDPYGRRDKRR